MPEQSSPAKPDLLPAALRDSPFLKACRREPVDVTPVWLMRQAGRYMAEYRAIRAKVPFLDLCKRPELATEVTVTAAEVLGVDAAILFADILLILEPLGFDLEFAKGEGPVIHNPVRARPGRGPGTSTREPRAPELRLPGRQLDPGGPEARSPAHRFRGRALYTGLLCHRRGGLATLPNGQDVHVPRPGAWNALMSRLVDSTVLYLNAQIAAGAQAIQLFDSWVGSLGPDDYRQFVQPHMARLFSQLDPSAPSIHFGTDTGALLELQREAGGNVIGLDWRVDLAHSWHRLGSQVAVQGNLDPIVLFAPLPEIERQTRRILSKAGGRPGHIFNLGHGILPQTPVDHVRALVDLVHAISRSRS